MNANERATHLAQELAGFLCLRAPCRGVALMAMAKLIGQQVALMEPETPADLLNATFALARDEMRVRALGEQLHAAGLGALMPERQA